MHEESLERNGASHIQEVMEHFKPKIFRSQKGCPTQAVKEDKKMIKSLKAKVKSEITELLSSGLTDADESYTLNISSDSEEIVIEANQYVGLVRGLSTVA